MATKLAKYSLRPQFQNLKQLVADIEVDVDKHDAKGNKAAGVRVYKAMQEAKKLAQGVRETVVQIEMLRQAKSPVSNSLTGLFMYLDLLFTLTLSINAIYKLQL
jgi:hypothetical protein